MEMLNKAIDDADHAVKFFERIAGARGVDAMTSTVPPSVRAMAEIADWNADVERRKLEKKTRQLQRRYSREIP